MDIPCFPALKRLPCHVFCNPSSIEGWGALWAGIYVNDELLTQHSQVAGEYGGISVDCIIGNSQCFTVTYNGDEAAAGTCPTDCDNDP
jgi:hypothetical protein